MALDFGTFARTAGSIGNEIMAAQTGLQDLNQKLTENKLKNLMDQLNIQKTQQSLTDPQGFQRQVAVLEQLLNRPLTEQEKLTFLGLSQQQPKIPDTPFAIWREQNPSAPISEWLKLEQSVKPDEKNPFADVRVGTDGRLYGVRIATGRLEQIPTPTGVKFPIPGPRPAAPSPALDQLVYGLASGQITKWPTGKLLAQTLNRAKELGVQLVMPKQTDKTLAAAQKEYQAELDKYNKWNTDHYMMRHFETNPYTQSLSEKRDKLRALRTGTGATTAPGAADPNDPSDLGATPANP